MSVRDYEKARLRTLVGWALLALLLPSRVFAQPNSRAEVVPGANEPPSITTKFSLRWNGTSNCDAHDRVLVRVQELIEGTIETRLSEPLMVYAVVEQDVDAMRVHLTLLDKLGLHERVLEGASCDELVEATALVLGLAINQSLALPTEAQALPLPNNDANERLSSGNQANVATVPLAPPKGPDARTLFRRWFSPRRIGLCRR